MVSRLSPKALQRTLEFEEELAEKFGGSTQNKEIRTDAEDSEKAEGKSQAVLDIKRKYEKKLVAHQGSGTEENVGHKDYSVPGTGIIFQSGRVYASGLNKFGQLGISDDNSYIVEPVEISGLKKEVKQISAGYDHSCAITEDGELYIWGRNSCGQLGLGKTCH